MNSTRVTPQIDRRIRRSLHVASALNYQLHACSERSGAKAFILTDKHGLVIAKSPSKSVPCEMIAAKMAHVKMNQFRIETLTVEQQACVVSARGFKHENTEFVLCTVGVPNDQTLSQINTAIGGIQRILRHP